MCNNTTEWYNMLMNDIDRKDGRLGVSSSQSVGIGEYN